MDNLAPLTIGYESVIADICGLNWSSLDQDDITKIAWAYYFFSIQFRENLTIAHDLRPDDKQLNELVDGECDTDNLSPWPGIVSEGEKVNHDEFMRRALQLSPIDAASQLHAQAIGLDYLNRMRAQDDLARAMSIGSYEDGGLERVFTAILTSPHLTEGCAPTPLLAAFRHFLVKHIEFDGDADGGHGVLARHLAPDDRILPLWKGFYHLFVDSVPRLKE
jgi:hypothetical protein